VSLDVGQLAADLLERGETLQPRLNAYIPHSAGALVQNHPKQALFIGPIVTPIREAFYGGAAGGGKSEALLMAALQFVDVPRYAAVIVRQTYPMLSQPGGLLERSHEWLRATDARWNQGEHRWTFPSRATLTFKHLSDSQAIRDYQGGEYQFIGVDEVTDFSEEQYTLLFSRLRNPLSVAVPLRMRSASNPIGPGKPWVHARFILAGPESGRLFVSARLEDNPALDIAEYERSLVELGSVAYRQLRHGDWDVKEPGRMFKRAWFEIVAPEDVPADATHVRYWDLAASETPKGSAARKLNDPDFTCGLLLARSESAGCYYVDDVERFRAGPHEVERRVAAIAAEDSAAVPVRMEQEGGASGKSLISHYRRNVLDGFDFRGVHPTGSKEVRAQPVAARAEAGEVKLVAGPWIDEFLSELASFPEGLHDDQVDALSGAFSALAGKPAVGRFRPQGETAKSYWLD
jgi:predicted phage terminase large subunit-like protein